MDDDMHLYDVVGYKAGGHRPGEKAEKITCLDDKEEYMCMSLYGTQQEESSEYEVPQWCARNTRAAVINDSEVIGSLHSHVKKDELRQMKKCLCVLSSLVVILFLVTMLSLSLAVYGFYSMGSSASSSTAVLAAVNNAELVSNHSFISFKEQLTQEAIQISENISNISIIVSNIVMWLETHLNATNQEIRQLKNSIATLDTRINDTDVQVISLVSLQSAVNMIESRVNITNSNLISLSATIHTLESQLSTTNAEVVSLRSFVNNLESRFNITNAEVIAQRTFINNFNSVTLVSLQSTVNMIESRVNITSSNLTSLRATVHTLESRLTTTNVEIVSQKTFVNNLEYRFNTTNAEVTTSVNSVRSSVTNLQNQLNTNVSSLQIALRSQPLIRLSRITIRARTSTFTATFAKLNSVTFSQQGSTTTISTSSSVAATSGNILAYRPNYQDPSNSNLATIFIHVEAVYPCATSYQHINCKLLPSEDDGFRRGRAILEAMDDGRNFGVFSGTTYAFALAGCSQITTSCYDSSYTYIFTLMCLVPSSVCYNTQ